MKPGQRQPRLCASEAHDDIVARHARLVRHEPIEVQHEARAAVGLRGEDRIEARGADVDAAGRQRELRVRQIQRDARRVVDGEGQRLRSRCRHAQGQLELLPRERLHVHGLELDRAVRAGRLRVRRWRRYGQKRDCETQRSREG
jgi:hypothetical protein